MYFVKYSFVALAALVMATGCTTTEKFTIKSPAQTKIYKPNDETVPLVTIPASGQAETEIPSDMYCGYVFVEDPGSGVKVPIGLDYKNVSHGGTKFAQGLGLGVAGVGSIVLLAGGLTLGLAGDDDNTINTGAAMAGVGAAVAGIGCSFGIPTDSRLKQTAYDYNFGYASVQDLHVPELMTQLRNPNQTKEALVKAATPSTTAKKTLADIAEKVCGTYSGSGVLRVVKNTVERYDNIVVVIERIDRTHVAVSVIENGEDYFGAPVNYVVAYDDNGDYSLVADNLPEATIKISQAGTLSYKHKRANIDDTTYTLEITAQK